MPSATASETHAQEPTPRGLRAVPVIGRRMLESSAENRIVGLAAEVAFFLLLSFPPALLAVVGAIGYVGDLLGPDVVERIRDQAFGFAGTFLTGEARDEILRPVVDSILAEGRAGIVSFGLLVALWSASRATNRMVETVRIAYGLEDRRPGWRRRLVSLGLTVAGMAAVVVFLPLLVAGPRLLEFLSEPLRITDALAFAWRILYWPVIVLAGVGFLATFYHLSVPWTTPWRRDLPGALLAVILWILGGMALRIYASLAVDGGVFGPLAAPIVFLLWLYVTALAILAGAQLNAQIEKAWPTAETVRERREQEREKRGEPEEDPPVPRGM